MYKSWTKRFARKIWKSPLALAVTAGILAGAGFMPSAFAADGDTLSFTQTITGTKADTEYKNSPYVGTSIGTNEGAKRSVYEFNRDGNTSLIEIGGVNVKNQYLDVSLRVFNGATLKVNDGISSYMHNYLYVNADNIIVNAYDKEGIFADGAGVVVNGKVNLTATGDKGKGLVAYLESIKADGNASGTYSTASLRVNGDATIDTVNHAVQASGADININGIANIHSSNGIGVRAMAYIAQYAPSYSEDKMANVNIIGGSIAADKYDAIHNEGSNVYLNNDGANSLVVNGNVVMLDRNGHVATTIMKLTDDQSSWTGGLYTSNYLLDNGTNMQLTLQNGSTWNNQGESFAIYDDDKEHLTQFDYTSTLAKLTGGADEAHAGIIMQNTSRDLDVKNYSGYTKVFYTHNNDGTTLSDFTGGDIIIGSAAEGSKIDIITDDKNISESNRYQVNSVLNNLAQKLVYSGAIVAEDHLTGRAIIAEGLTSNSKTVGLDKITFNRETGRGYLGTFNSQLQTVFTTPLTGVKGNDGIYESAYVLQESGEYKFTKPSSITVSGDKAAAVNLEEAATIIAGGLDLALNVNDGVNLVSAFRNNADGTTNMRVGNLNITANSANGAEGIQQTKGNLSIEGNVNINLTSTTRGAGTDNNVIGIYANTGKVTIDGDVTSNINTTASVGNFYYGASGIFATSVGGTNSPKGADIVVDGKVTLSGNANGLFADMGGSTITVGAADITVDKDKDLTNRYHYAALRAENGTVNVNVVLDENGKAISGANNDVNIKGNVVVGVGAMNGVDINYGKHSAINLALTTSNSSFQGVVDNQFGLTGQDHHFYHFDGDANIWLQNGATWTNEEYGGLTAADSSFEHQEYKGSLVSNFVGGNNIYTAGNIFQNDSNPLTINNYSGIAKVYYKHTGDGTARANYEAGDTIINHAAAHSEIYMLTDNKDIAVDNRTQVNQVLNALAGKLVYAGYVNGAENNLQGMVGIAEGLTTSDAIKVVKGITFSSSDGRGSYVDDEEAIGTFHTPITSTNADNEYLVAGVTRDYSDYIFNPLDYENKKVTILSEHQPGIIFNSGKDVYIDAPVLDLQIDGGITAARNLENPWMGSYLMINTINDEGASGKVLINKVSGNAIESTADVRIYGQADLNAAGNGIVAGLAGTNSGSVKITKGTSINAQGYGILADGGSVTLDSSNNNIVAADDAIHAVGHEVTYTDENQVDHTFKADGYVYVEGGHIESTEGKAVYSDNGKIYINVGGDHTTNIKGDVVATNGSQVNIKLTDADSSWVGRLDNVAAAEGIAASNVEMTMKNGALWTNTTGDMRINSFTGSETLKDAAYITRTEGKLTIDHLSGAVNFFYEHTGEGDSASDYAAGDTIIKSAESGSIVKLITNKNSQFNINDLGTYKGVLEALASKLVYSEYKEGARNLNGYLAIAEGLTYSGAELDVRSITFSNTEGRGGYIEVYEDGITGSDGGTRYEGNGVIKEENGQIIYTFLPQGQGGINYVIPSLKVQEVDKSLDVVVNSLDQAVDFKEKVYVSSDNKVTINGNVNINNGWVNAIESAGGNIILNNDLYIYSGGKGLTADAVVKTEDQQQVNRAGTITTNGGVDITTHGVAVLANGGTVNINQGGQFDTRYGDYPDAMVLTSDAIVAMEKVVAPYDDASEAKVFKGIVNIKGTPNYCIDIQSNGNALYSEGGIINVNTDGNASLVNIVGFLSGHASETGVAPEFNLVLNNDESRWEGRIRVDENAKVKLTLQDGATWATYRYYQDDKTTPELDMNNRVSNFVGSTGNQKAGIIRMNDYVPLYLENYSGNTILYYDHLMWYDGSEKWHYENGVQKADVHVVHAAPDSTITVLTDSIKIDRDNLVQVNKVLSTLASFLVYDGYRDNKETNLIGKVGIAESLSSSDLWAVADAKEIKFGEDGVGYYEGIVPGEYKTAITGSDADSEYKDKGITVDGTYDDNSGKYINTYNTYTFTENYNGQVKVPDIAVANTFKNMTITASDLTLAVDGGISVNRSNNITIDSAAVTIKTEKDKAITSLAGSLGIKGDLTINGAGKGIVAERAYNGNSNSQAARQAYVTVDGETNISTSGTAIEAIGADINLKRNANLSANSDTVIVKVGEGKLYDSWYQPNPSTFNMVGGTITAESGNALYVEGGTVNLNTEGGNSLIVNGDITLKTGVTYDEYGLIYEDTINHPSTVNVVFDTAASSWTGSLLNDGNTLNLTLQNGAVWTDAVTESTLANVVNNFTGSTAEQVAGEIHRNDTRNLTINNYSGVTNIFYAHGEEEEVTKFAAGDTIIKNAAVGSKVTLITQNGGLTDMGEDTVNNVLSALAGKLYYTGYNSDVANEAQNLTGKVAIAEGLTTSESYARLENIVFNPYTGQGTYGFTGEFIPPTQVVTEFTQAITGNGQDVDGQYYRGGVLQENGAYIFTQNSTITTNSAAINTTKNVNIDAGENNLAFNANAHRGINNQGGTLNIKGNLDIQVNSAGNTDGTEVYLLIVLQPILLVM